MSWDKQTSEKSMYDLILFGWSTGDVNANLYKSERNFTIDVRAGQVQNWLDSYYDNMLESSYVWTIPVLETVSVIVFVLSISDIFYSMWTIL